MKNLWKKQIVLFLVSQTISLFGSSLVQYAIMWFITLKTQSGIMMTISIICGFVPTFFLSPFAGVWADRFNRKTLIILADAMIAATTLVLAILFLMGYDTIWLLFVMSAIRALGTGVQTPAVGAFIPQIVPEDQLTKINATNGSVQSLVMLVSPMLSGALLTVASIEYIFFIDVITAAIAIFIMLSFLNVPPHQRALEKTETNYYHDMREGFVYIRNHAYVKKFFLFCAVFFFLAAPAAFLTPLQVARAFGPEVWRLTLNEVAFSVGMMIGGIIMASWGGFKNRVFTMGMSGLIMGISTLLLGIIPVFYIYIGLIGLFGIAMPFFNTPSTVLLQEKVDPSYIGRVFGVLAMLSSSMMPLGMLVFGPAADQVKIEWLLVGTGILLILESMFLLGNRVLLEAGKPLEKK